ncbi:MAG: class I SAM-dependent methyltransferase, partial [Burkholderiales bacterium]|nr:class I SAM-dependent methyltransferase [Opitutaceae bacterium]
MSPETSPPFATADSAYLAGPDTCGPLCRRMVLRAFRDMRLGHLRLELPEGGYTDFGSPADAATRALPCGLSATVRLRVRNPAFFSKCILAGDIGFAESYLDGDWDTPDLASLIAWFVLNVEHAPTLSGSKRKNGRAFFVNWLRLANRLGHLLRPNSRATARRNISEHYDLSNAFFGLFLDPSLMYSSARWPASAPDLSLADAQREKNDALCRSLRLQ